MRNDKASEYIQYRLNNIDQVKEEIREYGLRIWLAAFFTVASW